MKKIAIGIIVFGLIVASYLLLNQSSKLEKHWLFMMNEGFAVEVEDSIYLCNPHDDYKLYEYKSGDESLTKLADQSCSYLNYHQDKLYFIGFEKIVIVDEDSKEVFGTFSDIYSFDLKDMETETIYTSNHYMANGVIHDGMHYFVEMLEDGIVLKRIPLDTLKPEVVTTDLAYDFAIVEDKLYFVKGKSRELYSRDLETGEEKFVAGSNITSFSYDGEHMYFLEAVGANDFGLISTLSVIKNGKVELVADNLLSGVNFTMDNDYIYYTNNRVVYKANKTTYEAEILVDEMIQSGSIIYLLDHEVYVLDYMSNEFFKHENGSWKEAFKK